MQETLDLIEKTIEGLRIPSQPSNLYDPIRYIMSLGGKRLRPYLLLLTTKAFGGDEKKAVNQAIAIEIFHNFTLVHDDIMDHAPLRRGNETVHKKWSTNIAILSGDAMTVKAYEYLIENLDAKYCIDVLKVFNDTALKVCEGQQYDEDFEVQDIVSIDEYIHMIRLKTAELLGGAMQIGSILADASKEDQERIYEFAINIGIAFQLMDDLLDVYADQAKFGKQVGGDIIENKKTYLYLKLEEKISKEDLGSWNYLKSESDNFIKVEKVTSLYDQYGIAYDTKQLIRDYYRKGMTYLDQLSIEPSAKEEMIAFADKLMVREN